MKQFLNLPFDQSISNKSLLDIMKRRFPEYKVTEGKSYVKVKKNFIVHLRLKVIHKEEEQTTRIQYGTTTYAWVWLVFSWIYYLLAKKGFLEEIEDALRAQLSHRYKERNSFYFPDIEKRIQWNKYAKILWWISLAACILYILHTISDLLQSVYLASFFSLLHNVALLTLSLIICSKKLNKHWLWAGKSLLVSSIFNITLFTFFTYSKIQHIYYDDHQLLFSFFNICGYISPIFFLGFGYFINKSLYNGPSLYLLKAIIIEITGDYILKIGHYLIYLNAKEESLITATKHNVWLLFTIEPLFLIASIMIAIGFFSLIKHMPQGVKYNLQK